MILYWMLTWTFISTLNFITGDLSKLSGVRSRSTVTSEWFPEEQEENFLVANTIFAIRTAIATVIEIEFAVNYYENLK